MKRSPLRRIGKNRLIANREYNRRKKRYLHEHPYCQIFIRLNRLNEDLVIKSGGYYLTSDGPKRVPGSTEIHHSKKPRATYLNDESTWFSASQKWHRYAEDHLNIARLFKIVI